MATVLLRCAPMISVWPGCVRIRSWAGFTDDTAKTICLAVKLCGCEIVVLGGLGGEIHPPRRFGDGFRTQLTFKPVIARIQSTLRQHDATPKHIPKRTVQQHRVRRSDSHDAEAQGRMPA